MDNKLVSSISKGLLLFVGFHKEDHPALFKRGAQKISRLRIFPDEEGKMNRSLLDTKEEILVVSQFTLYADTSSGNRPSFFESAAPNKAETFYTDWCNCLEKSVGKVKRGFFGADMQVELVNDGPVTIWLDFPPAIS